MVPWLEHSDDFGFPPLDDALTDPNGLIAVGGDLSPERLINAYRRGIFPWYEDPPPVLWWSPDPRTVLRPDRVHISRSLKRRLRQGNFNITADVDFHGVIAACGALGERRTGTWITAEMTAAYIELHAQGYAHSVEVWEDGELAGGLYGIALGRMFFGESMFSRRRDGSKIALVALCHQLRRWGFGLIDCQVGNPHLTAMGAEAISRADFAAELQHLQQLPAAVGSSWTASWPSFVSGDADGPG